LVSAACTFEGCRAPTSEVGKVYSMLMFATCAILFCKRRLRPHADSAGARILVGCMRLLLTVLLTLTVVWYMIPSGLQTTSLTNSAWLQNAHKSCAGLCGIYILMLVALPCLYDIIRREMIRRRDTSLYTATDADALSEFRTFLPSHFTDQPLFATQVSAGAFTAPPISEREAITNITEDQSSTFRECTICYENPANAMCLPCRHASTCERCLLQVIGRPNGACPVCRAPIQSYDVTDGDSGYANTYVSPRVEAGPRMMLRAILSKQAFQTWRAFCCPSMGPGPRQTPMGPVW